MPLQFLLKLEKCHKFTSVHVDTWHSAKFATFRDALDSKILND